MTAAIAPPHGRRVAVVLDGELAPGVAANVAACIAAGLGAMLPGLAGRPLVDADGFASASSAHLPIAILRGAAAAISALLARLAQSPKPQARRPEASELRSEGLAEKDLLGDCMQYSLPAERGRAPEGGTVVVFPSFAQRIHAVEDYWREHALRAMRTEAMLGIGLAGPASWVRSLTGSLSLFR
jgi:hypothetical protein